MFSHSINTHTGTTGVPRQPYEGLHIMFYTRRSIHKQTLHTLRWTSAVCLQGSETAEELVTIIQNRIRWDANDYDVFVDMLHDTDGIDKTAKKLKFLGRNCIVLEKTRK